MTTPQYLRHGPGHGEQRGSHHRIPNAKNGDDGTLPFPPFDRDDDKEIRRHNVIRHHEGRVFERRQFVVVFVARYGGTDAGGARVRLRGPVIVDGAGTDVVAGGIDVKLRPTRDDGVFCLANAAELALNTGGAVCRGSRI